MNESVILCEGFHDRAFWAEWLLILRCTDPGDREGRPRAPVLDPWGERVVGGQFGFESRTRKFIRIVPCDGDSRKVQQAARDRLESERQRWTQGAEPRLTRLVLNVDPDASADGETARTGFRVQDLERLVRGKDPSVATDSGDDFALFDGGTLVSLIRWEAADPPAPGLPDQQALERVVCAAVLAAYPQRGPSVQDWLDSRPDPPPPDPKEHAWSYVAGWYAEHGCEDFFRHVWRDETIRTQLESRLRQSGAWRVAEALAE